MPESYLVSEENSAVSHTTQWYTPGSLVFQYSPLKARSVAEHWVTSYCKGVRRACRSAALNEGDGVSDVLTVTVSHPGYRDGVANRIVFLLRRRPELTRDEFQRIWWEEHAPLVVSHASTLGIVKYQQVHTTGDRRPDALPAFDGSAELWVDPSAAQGSPEQRRAASAALLADEQRFIDLAASPIWVAEEQLVRQGTVRQATDGEMRLTAALRRAPGITRADFRRHWREVHGPLALAHNDVFGFHHYVQLHTPDNADTHPLRHERHAPEPFDGVSEIVLEPVSPTPERARAVRDIIMEDEARFVDYARSAVFPGVIRLVI